MQSCHPKSRLGRKIKGAARVGNPSFPLCWLATPVGGNLIPQQDGRQCSKLWAMSSSRFCARLSVSRGLCPKALLPAALGLLLVGQSSLGAGQSSDSGRQHGKPLTLNSESASEVPNRRLILKDGSYQVVRRYEIVGDRVRYISVERGGDWEELPADLVDWDATRKWARDHASSDAPRSEAMKAAAALDKEEADERAAAVARRPEVAKGLYLPDEDSVFALDNFEGRPELVELPSNQLSTEVQSRKGLNTINPLAGARANLELDGQQAKIHLHVFDPAIYISLAARDDADQVIAHALTVDTHGAKDVANRKHGAHSEQSGFALVRLDQRRAVRIVGAVRMTPTGTVKQTENVVPTKVEVVYDRHWLKITPAEKLTPGEYALVEIVSPDEVSSTLWDFRVDPTQGDNEGSLVPIVEEKRR